MIEPVPVKKSITIATIEKEKKILTIAVICVISLFISTTYSILTSYNSIDNAVTFTTGNLNMTINNTNGLVTLNGKLPQVDEDAIANNPPISLVLTNTGNIIIEKYEVKLLSEDDKVSTLNDSYIKYAISEDGVNYTTISGLKATNNIIYTGYDLAVGNGKTIYLKVWIDQVAGKTALNKIYYGSIQVELYQKDMNR